MREVAVAVPAPPIITFRPATRHYRCCRCYCSCHEEEPSLVARHPACPPRPLEETWWQPVTCTRVMRPTGTHTFRLSGLCSLLRSIIYFSHVSQEVVTARAVSCHHHISTHIHIHTNTHTHISRHMQNTPICYHATMLFYDGRLMLSSPQSDEAHCPRYARYAIEVYSHATRIYPPVH